MLKKNLLVRASSRFNQFYSLIEITKSGRTFLSNSKEELIDRPTKTMLPFFKVKGDIWKSTDNSIPSTPGSSMSRDMPEDTETSEQLEERMNLYRLLMKKRNEIAVQENIMPYLVASNQALMGMSRLKPNTLKEMADMKFDRFTAASLEKFGKQLLDVLQTTQVKKTAVKKSIQEHLKIYPMPEQPSVTSTSGSSYNVFQSGKSIKQIAESRKIATSTVETHLITCLKSGYPIKLNTFLITGNVAKTIIDAIVIVNSGLSLLAPIKMACPDDITYVQVKALLGYLQIREHLNNNNLLFEEFDDPEYYEMYKKQRDSKQDNLDRLIEGLKDVQENGLDNQDSEDTNLSDDVLANACDILEQSLCSNDETVLIDEEPVTKKSKVDFTNLLDSPPRLALDTKNSEHKFKSSSDSPMKEEEKLETKSIDLSQNVTKTTTFIKKKNYVILPPWLTKKRAA